jgi:glycogen operon protein
MGNFPKRWGEWNDRFRDDVRRFWRGDGDMLGALATRIAGSADIFGKHGRPSASVNFLAAHDGFTLNDLVTYNERHNEANGERNRDGARNNRSWNCGEEGPSDDPGVNALRERQIRNMMATLLLAQGTPMILAGDEFGRTQGGNNNAYCQDNETSWLNWELKDKGQSLTRFIRRLTKMRHDYPVLRRSRFLIGSRDEELDVCDVDWINANGGMMQEEDWEDGDMRCFGMIVDGRARPTALPQKGKEITLLLVMNAHHDMVRFTLPQCPGPAREGSEWQRIADTNIPDDEEGALFAAGAVYEVTARSLLLFALREPAG